LTFSKIFEDTRICHRDGYGLWGDLIPSKQGIIVMKVIANIETARAASFDKMISEGFI